MVALPLWLVISLLTADGRHRSKGKELLKKAVVLLSGGLDSTTTLAIAQDEGYDTYAMSFRYGQRHAVELQCAKNIAKALGM